MIRNILLAISCCFFSYLSQAQELTNMGTDFWTGFGYHSRMNSNNGAGATLSIYISAKQATTVRVSLPGIAAPGFPKTVNVPANVAVEVNGFPTGGNDEFNPNNLPDARLYYTGINNRGIHIESLSGVPVAVYEHTYGTDAAGATLLFPVNTWGASYNVLTIGGTSNSGVPNSYFFVMAKEDNTIVDITPTANIQDSSSASIFKTNGNVTKYPSGVTFSITLNKGQIFNAMSTVVNGLAGDLTGTLVKTRNCTTQKIAVWAGNGRTFVNSVGCNVNSGSDNLIQQMLPRVAWGSKYLTTPTKTMEYAIYRICVQDPTTKVWFNNPSHTTPLTGLVNNFYYQVESNQPSIIESDKPVMVTQYILTGGCKNNTFGNNGSGDPEMIILSPVQQAINNISVFSASKLNISNGASYLNVVIKNQGIASFRLDNPLTADTGTNSYSNANVYGSTPQIPIANAFKVHPGDPNYSYARFKVQSGVSHNMRSDSGFNAIAYGMVQGESYGYNAGTAIKDLSAVITTLNPFDSTAGGKTCKGNASTPQIALPYLASQITNMTWATGVDPRVTPNGTYSVNNPVPVRTYTANDITYNVYNSPQAFTFNAVDTFTINVTITGTFSSECGGTQVVPVKMVVIRDTVDFNSTGAGCGSLTVTFTDATRPYNGVTLKSWAWEFGDATTAAVQNPPPHTYPAPASYSVKLRTINSIGCFADTTKVIDLSGGISAKFGVSPNDSICAGQTIVFSDSSLSSGVNGTINQWTWNFGDGSAPVVATTNASQSHTYNIAATYTATLQVKTSNNCSSNTFSQLIYVSATPVAAFTAPAEICASDSAQLIDQSTLTGGPVTNWFWNFGDGSTSNLQNPKYKWAAAGTYTVTLYVTSGAGCASAIVSKQIIVNALPVASFTFTSPVCATKAITFTNTSTTVSGVITGWTWNFGDGSPIQIRPNGAPFTYTYALGGTYTVSLIVTTDKGCMSVVATQVVTVTSTPLANFTLPGNLCLPSANATFTNTTTINDGTLAQVTYSWDFGDGSPLSTQTSPTHTYSGTGPYTVKLTARSNNGCTHDTSKILTTIFARPTAIFTSQPEVCRGDSMQFTNQSTAPGSSVTEWLWSFGDGNTSSIQNPKHAWATSGTYTVRLWVNSATGCRSDTMTKTIIVNAQPTAAFSFPAIRCAGKTITIGDGSTAGAGTISEWHWTFGDGGVLDQTTAAPVTHTYANAGSYTVTLWVKNNKGCISTTTSSTVVINPNPTANFTFTNVCIPTGTAQFTDASSINPGSVTGWLWDFGDATPTATTQNPSHTYTNGAAYPVKLTVTSAAGCTKDTTKTVPVYNAPTANFGVANNLCSNLPVTLTDSSKVNGFGTINKLEIFWDYANNPTVAVTDNTPTTNEVYTHQYPGFGTPLTKTFRVLVRAYSGSGCMGEYFKDITINAAPGAQLAAFAPVCQEVAPFALSGGSDMFNIPGGIGTYSGPGVTATQSFSPATAGPGTHRIRYTVTSPNGCVSFDDTTIVVNRTPVINAGADRFVIEGEDMTITTTGSGAISWLWTPSTFLLDPTAESPVSIKPTSDVNYTVRATSTEGCSASDNVFVKVVRDFKVPNTFTPNGDGINDKWLIENLSFYPTHRIQVFNRYGQPVYESKDYQAAWDGTFKGKEMPAGTYYYVIELGGSRKPKTGYVTVIK